MSQKSILNAYQKSSIYYDKIDNFFQLGFGEANRKKAMLLANIKSGDVVADLGCGTGGNFKQLNVLLKNKGKIIAIDQSENMIRLAKIKAKKYKMNNIVFVKSDLNTVRLAEQIDVAFFGYCWFGKEKSLPWVKNICNYLKDDGRLCFIDYRIPPGILSIIITPFLWIFYKILQEPYPFSDLNWDMEKEIGVFLKDYKFLSYFFKSVVTISGKPLRSYFLNKGV